MKDFSLLSDLCKIHAPSGNESALNHFIVNYVEKNSFAWKCQPSIYSDNRMHDCVLLGFGKNPKTAIYAHMDSVGYTVGHKKKLIPIGTPHAPNGTELVGEDSQGSICCTLHSTTETESNTKQCTYTYHRNIDPGTTLTYKPYFEENDTQIKANNLDNRVGIWVALKLAETLENGVIIFSCYEEHGGGSVPFLQRFIYNHCHIRQALIADITWVTEDIHEGKGCAISARDSHIPRKTYVDRILNIAKRAHIPFQIEVERSGGSDGSALQQTPYAVDWCFVGAPEYNPHEPIETINKKDIHSMLQLYNALMKEL
ncbi:MAG: hypothetical protein R6U95_07290 [Bacteroidales bacterium]